MRPAYIRNVSEVEETSYDDKPRGIGVFVRDIGAAIGTGLVGIDVTTLRPGKKAADFHHHKLKEEFFFVLEGRCRVRVGDSVHDLVPGDAVSRAPGTGVAHQFFNPYPAACRILMLGVMSGKGIADETAYPELGKKIVVSPTGARKAFKLAAPKAKPSKDGKARRR